MTFDEAFSEAGVPPRGFADGVHQADAHSAWLAVGSDFRLEVCVVRAVLRGRVAVDQVLAAHKLGGDAAVRDLLAAVGEAPRGR